MDNQPKAHQKEKIWQRLTINTLSNTALGPSLQQKP